MYYQWQSVRGDPKHFDILVISWQFEHCGANNWQDINNSHRTIKLWFNEEKLFHLIFHHIPKLSIGFNVSCWSALWRQFFNFSIICCIITMSSVMSKFDNMTCHFKLQWAYLFYCSFVRLLWNPPLKRGFCFLFASLSSDERRRKLWWLEKCPWTDTYSRPLKG